MVLGALLFVVILLLADLAQRYGFKIKDDE